MGEQVDARIIWGCSSVGRAPALQAGGQEFESLHLHLIMKRAAEPDSERTKFLERLDAEVQERKIFSAHYQQRTLKTAYR